MGSSASLCREPSDAASKSRPRAASSPSLEAPGNRSASVSVSTATENTSSTFAHGAPPAIRNMHPVATAAHSQANRTNDVAHRRLSQLLDEINAVEAGGWRGHRRSLDLPARLPRLNAATLASPTGSADPGLLTPTDRCLTLPPTRAETPEGGPASHGTEDGPASLDRSLSPVLLRRARSRTVSADSNASHSAMYCVPLVPIRHLGDNPIHLADGTVLRQPPPRRDFSVSLQGRGDAATPPGFRTVSFDGESLDDLDANERFTLPDSPSAPQSQAKVRRRRRESSGPLSRDQSSCNTSQSHKRSVSKDFSLDRMSPTAEHGLLSLHELPPRQLRSSPEATPAAVANAVVPSSPQSPLRLDHHHHRSRRTPTSRSSWRSQADSRHSPHKMSRISSQLFADSGNSSIFAASSAADPDFAFAPESITCELDDSRTLPPYAREIVLVPPGSHMSEPQSEDELA